MADHVLGHFNNADRKLVEEALEDVCEATSLIVKDEIDKAMNDFNQKKQR